MNTLVRWLLLAGSGVLAYVLLRPLIIRAELGAPIYDWAFYLFVTALLAGLPPAIAVRGLIGDAERPMYSPASAGQDAEVVQATSDLASALDDLRRRYPGLPVGVTAGWTLYLDGADGDADLAALERSPVDPPGNWAFVNLMAYSSYFPVSQRAYYTYSVERGLERRYPQTPRSYLIGLVGGGFPWEPLLSYDELVRDARLSRALGAREIVVFQLDGALKQRR